MTTRYVFDLKEIGQRGRIGTKAQSLRFLMDEGFRTPATLVCTWDAYLRHLEAPSRVALDLKTELRGKLDLQSAYAVRSSANVEDRPGHSFAGQFKSVLGARGVDQVLDAVGAVWASAQSQDVQAYLESSAIETTKLKMAVIIQKMVHPVLSGVSFSRNPMTGMEEVVIEAVEGSGEALVQQGVTPQRWINRGDTWVESPDAGKAQSDLFQEVVDQTKAVARIYGQPVDLEWVYDGHAIHWVQLRAIASLNVDIYSNRVSQEVFPGIIKPLVWSINVPLVNGAWVRLFTELIGPNDIKPEHLAKSFCYRAYFNMGTIGQIIDILGLPRESLEALIGYDLEGTEKPTIRPSARTLALLPRMLRFVANMLAFGRRIQAFLPTMKARYDALPVDKVDQLTESELIDQIDQLYRLTQQTAYYNIVTLLLMQVYNRLLRAWLSRLDAEFESLDLTAGMEHLKQFDPNTDLEALHDLYSVLDETVKARIRVGGYSACLKLPETSELVHGMERFIRRFGHLSDSGTDFSVPSWREDPDLVLQMIVNHAPRPDRSSAGMCFEDLEIPLVQRPLIHTIYQRARRFTFYREAIGSLYASGYGLFRVYVLALADRLVQRRVLTSAQDIFHLNLSEVRTIVDGEAETDSQARIVKRKREMAACRDVTLPSIIYGDHIPSLEPQTSGILRGTPTSRGQYTGPVKVIRSLGDGDTLREGDVLVIPYSDVGWTTLFTRAGAVIAESGGLLSHSSIVAREYGIPAVVSVPGACQLEDGVTVTVNGYRGDITLQRADARLSQSEDSRPGMEHVP